jgi:hypothetical protein
MTATRAGFCDGLEELARGLRKDPSVPLPAYGTAAFPLAIYASQDVTGAAGITEMACSLGLEDWRLEDAVEDGMPYLHLRGRVGEVWVQIVADTGPRLLDPLADDDPSLIGAAR